MENNHQNINGTLTARSKRHDMKSEAMEHHTNNNDIKSLMNKWREEATLETQRKRVRSIYKMISILLPCHAYSDMY